MDLEDINLRQSMVETICSEKTLLDTLRKGSGLLRGMPGETEAGHVSTSHGCADGIDTREIASATPYPNV